MFTPVEDDITLCSTFRATIYQGLVNMFTAGLEVLDPLVEVNVTLALQKCSLL
jgi:hypothetical protein